MAILKNIFGNLRCRRWVTKGRGDRNVFFSVAGGEVTRGVNVLQKPVMNPLLTGETAHSVQGTERDSSGAVWSTGQQSRVPMLAFEKVTKMKDINPSENSCVH